MLRNNLPFNFLSRLTRPVAKGLATITLVFLTSVGLDFILPPRYTEEVKEGKLTATFIMQGRSKFTGKRWEKREIDYMIVTTKRYIKAIRPSDVADGSKINIKLSPIFERALEVTDISSKEKIRIKDAFSPFHATLVLFLFLALIGLVAGLLSHNAELTEKSIWIWLIIVGAIYWISDWPILYTVTNKPH